MKERPIIFSAESVRAILDGRKTQTRRVIRPQPQPAFIPAPALKRLLTPEQLARECPYGQPGDRLWIRETWAVAPMAIHYRANNDFESCDDPRLYDYASTKGWRSPIHMPRWASRITLEVTDVRVERLQSISERDAIAEGCGERCDHKDAVFPGYACENCMNTGFGYPPQLHFKERWDDLNAKRGFPWSSDPWVWVVEFHLLEETKGAI